jgi:hypothetical protein
MKSLYNQGVNVGGSDTYYTPTWVTCKLPSLLGDLFLDPCPGDREIAGSTSYDRDTDGLELDWTSHGRSFVNPPFSQMKYWIDKASLSADQGHQSLWFTKLDYRTSWFQDLAGLTDWIMPVTGYVRFEKEDGTLHNAATFQMSFASFGGIDKQPIIDAYRNKLYLA